MSNKTATVLILLLILACIGAGVWAYPLLPEKVASHWDEQGNVNGYMSKFWGVFLVPLMLIGLAALFWAIPKIDPLRANIETFRREYNLLVLFVVVFLAFVFALTLLWNLGIQFDLSSFIISSVGILFFFLGLLMPKMKRNWFIGIRTPWTLSSDTVWDKTHRQGGTIFKLLGILIFADGFIFPSALGAFIALTIFSTLWLVVYSYLEYRTEKHS
jgi:uncharacterized membrane protein